MLLQLAPSRVRMRHAVAGDRRPLAEIWPRLRTAGVRAVSESGVLGDPTGATAADGRALLDALAGALIQDVAQWLRTQ